MCTFTDNERETLETKLTAYKIVAVDKDGNYIAPLMNVKYHIIEGNTVIPQGNETVINNHEKHVKKDGMGYYISNYKYDVCCGFIHCFLNYGDAEDMLHYVESWWTNKELLNFKLFKCEVPQGTDVYKGYEIFCNRKLESVAAKKIVLKEEITWN